MFAAATGNHVIINSVSDGTLQWSLTGIGSMQFCFLVGLSFG